MIKLGRKWYFYEWTGGGGVENNIEWVLINFEKAFFLINFFIWKPQKKEYKNEKNKNFINIIN